MSASDGHGQADASTEQRRRERRWPSVLVACLPTAIVVASAVLALVLAESGASRIHVEQTIVGIVAAIVTAGFLLAMMPALSLWRKETVIVVLVGLTIAASIAGFAVWLQAISIACHGAVDCPLG